jgi:hypothetical protein
MNIRQTLFRLVNTDSAESLEEVNDRLEDIIDVLIEMNGLKKAWYTGSPYTYFEEKGEQRMSINHSYNAGYHRGLNTEYHDVPVEELFVKWIADVRRPATGTIDLAAFEEGLRDGIVDYDWKKNEEILHDRPHKEVGRARAAKVHRVLKEKENEE